MSATLTIIQGPDRGRAFSPGPEATVVGRASPAVPINDITVSRRHFELRAENGAWLLEDLNSSNGTYVNGKRIERPVRLRPGDTIRIGSTILAWAGPDPESLPRGDRPATDLVSLDAGERAPDTAVLSSVPSNDDSVILASPAAADAVRAWRVMAQLAEAIGTVEAGPTLLDRVMDILFEEVPAERGFILMRSEATGEYVPSVVRYRGRTASPDKIAASRTIIDHVVSRREGLLCTNAQVDERFGGRRRSGSVQAYGPRSIIAAPIMARDLVLGVLHCDSPMSAHVFTEEQLRLVTAIGRMSGIAIEHARLVGERIATARLAATGEVVASLSHSIKNILQGMRSGADVVELGLSRQSLGMIDQGWQIVQRNLEKTYNLTLNMLAYAKDRRPRLEMESLNRVVREALELVQRRAADKAVLLRPDLQEPFPPIPFDADGLHQVILNLLFNAIDASPKTTGVINVRTRFDAEASEAVLSVGDNGPGIPSDEVDHLFTPFHSTKGHGGTGLGMAVTRKIIDEHLGHIEVKSEPGHGTLIVVRLPATEAASSSATVTGAKVAPTGEPNTSESAA